MYTQLLFCSLFLILSSKIHVVPTLFFRKKKKKIEHIFGEPTTLPKLHWIRLWEGHSSISRLKKHTVKAFHFSAITTFLRSIPETFKKPVKESKFF